MAEKDRSGHYRKVTRNLTAFVAVMSLSPLLLITIIVGYRFDVAYRENVIAYLEQYVERHARDVDVFLQERLANIKVLGDLNSPEHLGREDFLAQALRELQEEYRGTYVDLGLVNSEGTQVAYVGPFRLAKVDYGSAEWFREAMERKSYISDVFLGVRGLPHFIVAVRLRSGDGDERSWILRSTIDFAAFTQLAESVRPGSTGQAFIINREGKFQTRTGEEMSAHVPLLQGLIWRDAPAGGARGEGSGERWEPEDGKKEKLRVWTHREKNPVSGRSSLYVVTYLKSGDWALAFCQDQAEAMADLYAARNTTIVLVLCSSAVILLLAFLLSRRLARRMEEGEQSRELMSERVIEAGRLASIGELAAGIAHEINNPVAVMVEEAGWVEDLLQEGEFGGTDAGREMRRAVQQVQAQGRRCKLITHKLLSFARKTDPEVKDVQVNDIVRAVVDLAADHAKFENTRIRLDLGGDLPEVSAAPSELQQVVLNLINNSIDAVAQKKGGTVAISTCARRGEVHLSVQDDGTGIPEANLKRIFDPFFSTKPVGKGTGLGLSICYGIVEKMGGEIRVESTLGVGTAFRIRLPASGMTLKDKGTARHEGRGKDGGGSG